MSSTVSSRRLAAACALGLGLGTAAAADPDDAQDRLRFNGFATVGAAYSDMDSPWEFRRDNLQPGADSRQVDALVDTRIGLQANYAIARQWEAVGQVVAKRLAESAAAQQYLEWAFVAYRPTEDWTLRLGRTSPDLFLLADYRNVGFAYPWVRPNSNFYGWVPVYALDGFDATREWTQGEATWRAKAFVGGGNAVLPGDASGDIDLHGDKAFGATLSREEGGLTVKLSYFRMRGELKGSDALAALAGALDAVAALPLPIAGEAAALRAGVPHGTYMNQYVGLGASYDRGPWLLHGEWSRVFSELAPLPAWQAYGSVGYRTGAVTWFGMLGHTHPLNDAAPTPDWPAELQAAGVAGATVYNMSRIAQTTSSIGARWDFHPQAALKLQLDHFRVRENGSSLWYRGTTDARSGNAIAFTVDAVF